MFAKLLGSIGSDARKLTKKNNTTVIVSKQDCYKMNNKINKKPEETKNVLHSRIQTRGRGN